MLGSEYCFISHFIGKPRWPLSSPVCQLTPATDMAPSPRTAAIQGINTREVTMCVIDGSMLIFEFEILPLLA
jgi:hypothetical protein